ncbi:MAG: peroxiredoxin [Acidobacteria bacterium]|nr:peroxiredoxin [Acidobacteriota bacterium]
MTERIQAGGPAPDFDLLSPRGKKVKLSNLVGDKFVVLYFYPKDDTPGCTQEARDFGARIGEFRDLGAEVLGVSVDSLDSHEAFQKKFEIPFPLLSDSYKLVSKNYGALNDKGTMADRVTFLIGKDGMIKKVFDPVNVENHVGDVLSALTALKS